MKSYNHSYVWIVLIAAVTLSICSVARSENLLPGQIHKMENECRFMLRTLATAEYSYLEHGKSGSFGAWLHLQEAGYIPEGYGRADYIEGYSIMYFNVSPSTYMGVRSAYDSSFTIVAAPKDLSNGLDTFGIDQNEKIYFVTDYEALMTSVRHDTVSFKHKRVWSPLQVDFVDRERWEKDCVTKLMRLGENEYAYRRMDPNFNFGTWWSLQQHNFIPKYYDRASFIENYSIAQFRVGAWSRKGGVSTYTIVAVPRSQKHQLRTFGIGTNNEVMVWVGRNGMDLSDQINNEKIWFDNPEYWRPLR